MSVTTAAGWSWPIHRPAWRYRLRRGFPPLVEFSGNRFDGRGLADVEFAATKAKLLS